MLFRSQYDKKGILSITNAGPGTNGSQFFITQVPTPHLNGRHTVFGETVKGLEVIDAIANTKTVANDKPEKDIKINKITIIANGKDAKNFNAVKVFENYFKDIAKREQEKETKTKAAAAKFLEEVKTQESQAKALPSGVKMFTLVESKGKQPNHTQQVMVNYAGVLRRKSVV